MKLFSVRSCAVCVVTCLMIPSVIVGQDEGRNSRLSLGLEFNLDANSDIEKDQENNETDKENSSYFRLMPWVGIHLSPRLELRPGIAISRSTSSTSQEDSQEDREISRSQFGVGAEVGLYYYFINKRIIRFATGVALPFGFEFTPRVTIDGVKQDSVYDSYLETDIGLNIPLYLDIIPAERFGVRIGMSAFSFNVNILSAEAGTYDNLDVSIDVNSGFSTILGYLSVSFFFLL